MQEMKLRPATGPHVWRGADMARRTDWRHALPAAVIDALDRVALEARRTGRDQDSFDFEATDVPALRDYGASIRKALAEGYGFVVARGLPVERYDPEELKVALLVLGHHIGLVGPQQPRRQGIGEVMDIEIEGRKEFYFHAGGPLPFHMDPVDAVCLLAIRKARRGGESQIVSSMAVHNEILRERPDLLALLYRGYYHERRETRRDGNSLITPHRCPIFADIGSDIVCCYLPAPILFAVTDGAVTMSDDERAALAQLDATAARKDLVLDMDLEPGDLQFLNNRHILHSRADYEDYPERDRRRFLLRLWMTLPDWPKLPPTIPHADVELETTPA